MTRAARIEKRKNPRRQWWPWGQHTEVIAPPRLDEATLEAIERNARSWGRRYGSDQAAGLARDLMTDAAVAILRDQPPADDGVVSCDEPSGCAVLLARKERP